MAVEIADSDGPEPAELPAVTWTPAWPDCPLSTTGIAIRSTISTVLLAVTAVVIAIAVSECLKGYPLTALGIVGIAAVPAALCIFLIDDIMPFISRISHTARTYASHAHGTGVKLIARRTSPSIHLAVAGVATYGIAGWLDWRSNGSNNGLLPMSKNSPTGAMFALIIGLLLLATLAFMLIVSHWKFSVYIYIDGIVRVISLPFSLGNSVFIAWEDIRNVAPGEFRPSEQSRRLPTIDLHLNTSRPPVHPRLDTPDHVALPIYALACESNTLLSRIQFLSTNPASRPTITRPDAPLWFKPPPLSERRQLSTKSQEGSSAE